MDRLLMFHASYCTLHIMHCIMWILSHTCSHMLDPVEPEVEEPTELALVQESTNTELIEGKPQCIPPIIP
jgi:hypothetical protein